MNDPGPDAAAKQSTSVNLPAVPVQQLRQAPEKDLAEAFGRMQQHLFQDLRAVEKSQAAEFVRGVYGQNQFVHLSSW